MHGLAQEESGKKKAHKHKLSCSGCSWDDRRNVLGTNLGFLPILHNRSPVCPRDKPSLSLGQSRGRRVAEKVYVLKVDVPFSLAKEQSMFFFFLCPLSSWHLPERQAKKINHHYFSRKPIRIAMHLQSVLPYAQCNRGLRKGILGTLSTSPTCTAVRLPYGIAICLPLFCVAMLSRKFWWLG